MKKFENDIIDLLILFIIFFSLGAIYAYSDVQTQLKDYSISNNSFRIDNTNTEYFIIKNKILHELSDYKNNKNNLKNISIYINNLNEVKTNAKNK